MVPLLEEVEESVARRLCGPFGGLEGHGPCLGSNVRQRRMEEVDLVRALTLHEALRFDMRPSGKRAYGEVNCEENNHRL
jgi:hypothetical protein